MAKPAMTDDLEGYTKIDAMDLPATTPARASSGILSLIDAATKTVWLSQSPESNEVVIDLRRPIRIKEASGSPISRIEDAVAFAPKVERRLLQRSANVMRPTSSIKDIVPCVQSYRPDGDDLPDGVAYILNTKQVTVRGLEGGKVLQFPGKTSADPCGSMTAEPQAETGCRRHPERLSRIGVPQTEPHPPLPFRTSRSASSIVASKAITKTFARWLTTSIVKPLIFDPASFDLVIGTAKRGIARGERHEWDG